MSYLISGAHVVVDINSDAGAFLWLILRWLLRACHCVDGRDGMGWDGLVVVVVVVVMMVEVRRVVVVCSDR